MTLDIHSIFTMLLGAGLTLLSWMGKELWAAVKALRADLQQLEVEIGKEYVRYDRLQDVMAPVLAKLDRIEAALSHKVDRP